MVCIGAPEKNTGLFENGLCPEIETCVSKNSGISLKARRRIFTKFHAHFENSGCKHKRNSIPQPFQKPARPPATK